MPKPAGHSWPSGTVMPVPVAGTGRAQARIAHDVQDARKTRLQHIDNNHPNAIANDPQTAAPAKAQRRAGTMATMTLSTAFTRMFSLRQTLARLST